MSESAYFWSAPGWPTEAWPFSRPKSYLGHDGGAVVGSGPGIAVGAALAARGSGRTVVAIIGDGELLAAPTALWTAAHHDIPVLFVIANNQSYRNDEQHQDRVARARGRDPENSWIGQRMDRPAIDYAALARDLGAAGIGPVLDPESLPGRWARRSRPWMTGGRCWWTFAWVTSGSGSAPASGRSCRRAPDDLRSG